MKLIFLLFLVFAPLNLCQTSYINSGELAKYNCRTIYPSEGLDRAYYIKTSNFPKDDKLYFKMIMQYGYFQSKSIRYGSTNEILGSPITLGGSKSYDSASSTSFSIVNIYITETYYYSISKPSQNYLYVAPPTGHFHYSGTSSYVQVCSTDKSGISIWVWIGVGAFLLIVIILSIVFYRYKRMQRQKAIDPLIAEPIALNVSPNTYDPNANAYPGPSPYIPNPSPYGQQPPTYY